MKTETIRETALDWWSELSLAQKIDICNRYYSEFSCIEKIWWAEMEANAEQFAKENPTEETTVVEKLKAENEQLKELLQEAQQALYDAGAYNSTLEEIDKYLGYSPQ